MQRQLSMREIACALRIFASSLEKVTLRIKNRAEFLGDGERRGRIEQR
jgi:hypothetical protein